MNHEGFTELKLEANRMKQITYRLVNLRWCMCIQLSWDRTLNIGTKFRYCKIAITATFPKSSFIKHQKKTRNNSRVCFLGINKIGFKISNQSFHFLSIRFKIMLNFCVGYFLVFFYSSPRFKSFSVICKA